MGTNLDTSFDPSQRSINYSLIGEKESVNVFSFAFILGYFAFIFSYAKKKLFDLMYFVVFVAKYISSMYILIKQEITKGLYWDRGYMFKYFIALSIILPIFIVSSIAYLKYNEVFGKTKQFELTTKSVLAADRSVPLTNLAFTLSGTNVNKNSSSELISWYTVKAGDTIDSISKNLNLSPSTIEFFNNLSSTSTLTPGSKLSIVPLHGIIYTVNKGDTLRSISNTYAVSESSIESWNIIPNNTVSENQKIFIPGAKEETINTFYGNYSTQSPGCPATDYYCYLQNDSRWGSMILGGMGRRDYYVSPYYGDNLASVGCLVTDVAMVAKYYYPSKNITPATIAYNPYYFVFGDQFTLSGLGLLNLSTLGSNWGSVNWDNIDNQLELGHPVIIGFSYADHYVLLTKKVGNDYLMNDPAHGGDLLLSHYYDKSYASLALLYLPK